MSGRVYTLTDGNLLVVSGCGIETIVVQPVPANGPFDANETAERLRYVANAIELAATATVHLVIPRYALSADKWQSSITRESFGIRR